MAAFAGYPCLKKEIYTLQVIHTLKWYVEEGP